MTAGVSTPHRVRRSALAFAGLLLVLAWFLLGINWGLPSRRADAYLFGAGRQPWTGAQIMELLPGTGFDSDRGADVDDNPIDDRARPVALNKTDAQRAEIVRRYRLFSYQPDEVITMMSLSGMRPGEGKLDPRLYQYGGLWVYGVGAMLQAASILGFVELKGGAAGLAYYLDHPEAFGRFYVVARLYSALWGVLGAWAVYALARRFATPTGAAAAAACYALMPVVVNQAHEAKPHLAGLTLMLLAILAACRYAETGGRRWWVLAGASCGAAFGMVISSLIIFAILPLMTLFRRDSWARRARTAAGAAAVGALVYVLTNPYVPYNLLFNRALLQSNLGTSTAMYQVSGSANGFINGLRLVAEGTSPLLAAAGLAGAAGLLLRARRRPSDFPPVGVRHVMSLLALPAAIVMVQFVALGAGKPGEYGRFALLPDTVLCVMAVAGIYRLTERPAWRGVALAGLIAATGVFGVAYTARFIADAAGQTSRLALAERLDELGPVPLAVTAEPAPYCLPPVNLFDRPIELLPRGTSMPDGGGAVVVRAVDDLPQSAPPEGYRRWESPEPPVLRLAPSRISWAAKPFEVLEPAPAGRSSATARARPRPRHGVLRRGRNAAPGHTCPGQRTAIGCHRRRPTVFRHNQHPPLVWDVCSAPSSSSPRSTRPRTFRASFRSCFLRTSGSRSWSSTTTRPTEPAASPTELLRANRACTSSTGLASSDSAPRTSPASAGGSSAATTSCSRWTPTSVTIRRTSRSSSKRWPSRTLCWGRATCTAA